MRERQGWRIGFVIGLRTLGGLVLVDAYAVWMAFDRGPAAMGWVTSGAAVTWAVVLAAQWGVRRLRVPSEYWLRPDTSGWLYHADRILTGARRLVTAFLVATAAYYGFDNLLHHTNVFTRVSGIAVLLVGAAAWCWEENYFNLLWELLTAPATVVSAAWLLVCVALFAAAWLLLRQVELTGARRLSPADLGFTIGGLSMASAFGGAVLLGVSRLLRALGARTRARGEGAKAEHEGRAAYIAAEYEGRAALERAEAERVRAVADRDAAQAKLLTAEAERRRAEAEYLRAEKGLPPLAPGPSPAETGSNSTGT
ncbi:hypothetical protein [Actinomadura yumaensis]|uniref:Uncharacterized protein n=1 Tax=Actinomadura yumaensis TaxID=111807 RepID=A0ABW2CSA4_9ACTN